MSAAIAAAAIAAGGAAYAANEQSKAGKRAAAGSRQAGADAQAWEAQQTENQNNQNKANQIWAQGLNQAAYDKNLVANRANQTSDFGSTAWNKDPVTGAWSQTNSLAPEQQAMLGSLRGQEGSAINALDSGNGYDSQAMGAFKQQAQVGLDESRNKENARLAAMGLGTGSGSAWGTAQDALNRSQNDSDQKAILYGQQAFNNQQGNARSNLAATTGTESTWKQNSLQPTYAQGQTATVNAPSYGSEQNYQYGADQQANQIGLDSSNAQAATYVNGLQGALKAGQGAWSTPTATNQPKTTSPTNAQIMTQAGF